MRIMKTRSVLATVFAALAFAAAAPASALTCIGAINYLALGSGTYTGQVVVGTVGTPPHAICSIEVAGPPFSVSPTVCKGVYAGLLAAKVTSASISLYYTMGGTCASIAAWSVQPSFYLVEPLN